MIQTDNTESFRHFKMIVEKRFPFGIVISPGGTFEFLKVDRPKYDACNDKTEKKQHVKQIKRN